MTTVNGKSMIPDPLEEMEYKEVEKATNRWNLTRFRYGKWRDTKKKLNRGVRKNKRIISRASRRANR